MQNPNRMKGVLVLVRNGVLVTDQLREARELDVTLHNFAEFERICPVLFQRVRSLDMREQHSLLSLPDVSNALRHLSISDAEQLQSLCDVLPALRSLVLESCPELYYIGETPVLRQLTLTDLQIRALPRVSMLRELTLTACDNIKALPDNLPMLGSLTLCDCGLISSTPAGMKSLARLSVLNCDGLRMLRPGMVNLSRLDVNGARLLRFIPLDMHELEDVSLANCPELLAFPSGNYVDVDVSDCSSLRTIGPAAPRLQTLTVDRCALLRSLPSHVPELVVLDLRLCPKVRTLPPAAKLETLRLETMKRVRGFPPSLRRLRRLALYKCPLIRHLPKSVNLLRDISVDTCSGFRMIHDEVRSDAMVSVWNCAIFTGIGEQVKTLHSLCVKNCPIFLSIHGAFRATRYVGVNKCSSFRGFDYDVTAGTEIVVTECPRMYHLTFDNLRTSNLVLSKCERLGGLAATVHAERITISACPSMRFEHVLTCAEELFSVRDCPLFYEPDAPEEAFDAAKFMANSRGVRVPDNDSVWQYVELFAKGVSKHEPEAAAMLKDRLLSVLEFMETACHDTRAMLYGYMWDSVNSCHDKPVWALNQMNVMLLVHEARGERMRLRALGKRVMRLEYVHQSARQYVAMLEKEEDNVDDVCVYMVFEIALKDRLQLPLCTNSMIFSNVHKVPQEALDNTYQEVLEVTEASFDAWLETWPEWTRFQRTEDAKKLDWSALSEVSAGAEEEPENMRGERVSDLVMLRGNVWSLADVLEHWVNTGRDMYNQPLGRDELYGISRVKQS